MRPQMEPAPAKGTRKARADVLRNREKLLAAAAEVFRAGGSKGSLDAVARRAGVGIGTLYRHFPTREALFDAVYRHEIEQLSALADELVRDHAPLEALRLWLRANVAMIATKKGMLAALAVVVDRCSELYAYSARRQTETIARLLASAAGAGAISPDVSAEDMLHTLIGLCVTRDQPGWEAAVVRLLDVFIDGLASRAAT